MGSTELGANIFRITQTEALLEKQEMSNELIATNIHYKDGKAVRDAIKKWVERCLKNCLHLIDL